MLIVTNVSVFLGICFSLSLYKLRLDPTQDVAPLLTTISDLIGISLFCLVIYLAPDWIRAWWFWKSAWSVGGWDGRDGMEWGGIRWGGCEHRENVQILKLKLGFVSTYPSLDNLQKSQSAFRGSVLLPPTVPSSPLLFSSCSFLSSHLPPSLRPAGSSCSQLVSTCELIATLPKIQIKIPTNNK